MALRVKGLLPKIVTLAGVTALAVAMPQPALAQPALGDSGASGQAAQDIATIADEYVAAGLESDTGLWIVQLDQPSLATYAGDIAGLPATSPAVTGTPKLDVNAPASHAYLNHLDQVQAEAIEAMENALGRSIEVAYQYQNVLNGLAVRVSAAEAAQLATLPGVAAVLPDIVNQIETDVSNDLIGSPSIWNGDTGPDLGTRGEGVIVGMLDTGVNAFHPSFAAVDGDGYAHTNPYGAGNYVGVCDPSHPNHQPVCNDKLIGAWNFNTNGPNFPSALDWNGHGSHVGSTIAGNKHEATFTFGQTEFTRTISGVAPRANVISYLVCDPGCPQSASVAAINQAIADGVDVLNYSISGTDNPWQDSVDLAFLDAFEAGIVVSASAGNSGPNTVAKTGPWNLSVAASTTKRIFAHTVDVDAHGITDLPAVPGDGPQVSADIEGELRVVAGNRDGCSPFPAGAFDGAIALIQRGGCEFGIKVNNADAAGAIAVVLFNNQGGPPTAPGGLGPNDHNTQIPTVMLEQRTGEPLWDLIIDQGPVDARINLEAQMFIDAEAWEDVMGAFSSTGPSRFEMLAPTVTAPGVNILAAVEADGADTDRYGLLQGTSMSSPHAAGSAALLVALHPDWTPAQIRSALASTADPEGIRAPDGVSEANPFHYGSGRVNLDAAGRIGLVMDETHANFVAANPATGGDPKTLNLPAFVNHECYECTWERTVTSVADTTVTYEVEWTKPADMGLEVTPSTFTIAPGESVDITVTVNGSALPNGQWAFADLRLVTNGTHANGQPVADVHYPIAIIASDRPADAPSISVEPDELSSVQGPDQVVTKELTIGNTGTAPLNWSVLEDATRLPQGATSPVTASAGSVAVEGATLTTAPRLLSGVFGPPAPRVVMPESPATPANTITITHSQSQAIVELNSVACSPDNGATTTENSYLRTFTLADFGITSDFAVSEVSFGVETLRSSPQTITVNVYRMTDPSSSLTYSNLTLLGSTDQLLQPMESQIVSVPVSAVVPAGSTMVVEIDAPDLRNVAAFFIGSNPNGQTAPSYLASASCGITEPTDLAAIGFPEMHIVMSVTGSTDLPPCEVPSWLSVSPTAGSVAPGGQQTVQVSFDSTGLSVGDVLEANLCIESNDPAQSVVVVPVTLEVEDVAAPVIEVTPEAVSAEVPAGSSGEETLTITNTGDAALDWSISEAEQVESGNSVQDVLYDNGPFVTHPGAGPGGSDHSVLQVASLGMTTLGGNVGALWDARMADDFTVGAGGWDVETITFYGYQTGSSTASSFTGVNYRIWDGPPDQPGSTVIYGDTTTNRMLETSWTNAYRVSETTVDTTRPIMSIVAEGGFQLAEGTYWLDWQLDGDLTSGPWQPPITIIGQTTTGNGLQFFEGVWQTFLDSGTNTPQGSPFTIQGVPSAAEGCAAPTDITWLSVSPSAGVTAPGASSEVTVTFDASGLAPGEYEALLCVTSNDPATPVVEVPVVLTVVEEDPGPGPDPVPVVCDTTITGVHVGALHVTEGVTCLAAGAQVLGEVNVSAGAGLVATAAVVQGPVSALGASVLELAFTQVTGPVVASGGSGSVWLFANQVTGSVTLVSNVTDGEVVVSGNTVIGSLSCFGNDPAPTNLGLPNTATAGGYGQCEGL